jgi:putative NADH-flavin reductase
LLIDKIRAERNVKIAETDDLVYVPDYPAGYMDQILAYRAALRDITNNIDPAWTDIIHVVWPTKPNFI